MTKKCLKIPIIQDLYPDLSREEQIEAKATLQAYVSLVWKIYNRLKSEGRLDEIKKLRLHHEWEKHQKDKHTK